MDTLDKEIVDDKLTQADLIKLMLHNAQHMATRDEVKADITKTEANLRSEISKVEKNLKADISKVDAKLSKVETNLRSEISKVDAKFDRIQWLIVATILTILLKDYVFSLLG